MPTSPQLVLDTNVCGKLVDLYQKELPQIVRRMNRDFRLVTSPQTLAELMYGIVNGTGEHLECDKEKIRIMLGTKAIKVLQYPAIFAIENVLDLSPDHVKQRMPSEMAMRLKILLRARSYQALVHDGVRIPSKGRRKKGRLLPEMLKAEMQAGTDDHNDLMLRVRKGQIGFPTPRGYAKSLAKGLWYTLNDEQAIQLAAALDAIYLRENWLYEVVGKGSYNYADKTGDWVDGGLLFYLSDTNLHILTDDGKLRQRVERSNQVNRIILLRDFLRDREFAVLH